MDVGKDAIRVGFSMRRLFCQRFGLSCLARLIVPAPDERRTRAAGLVWRSTVSAVGATCDVTRRDDAPGGGVSRGRGHSGRVWVSLIPLQASTLLLCVPNWAAQPDCAVSVQGSIVCAMLHADHVVPLFPTSHVRHSGIPSNKCGTRTLM